MAARPARRTPATRSQRAAQAVDRIAAPQTRPAPEPELALLLAERAERRSPVAGGCAGAYPGLAVQVVRHRLRRHGGAHRPPAAGASLPADPARHAVPRLGRVARRAAGTGRSLDDALWDGDDDASGTEASAQDEAALDDLRRRFLASEWADLQPLEVETEIDFTETSLDGSAHIVICKLDAVYRRADHGGRIEIVDWKTGAPPRDETERGQRMLQLELYRRAYHEKHAVPLDQIDVALYYVAHDLVLRG